MIDASTMLNTFLNSFPGFELFLNGFVSLTGLVLAGLSLFKFVELGRHGAQPGGITWATPVMYLITGVALINFASSVDTALETIYGGGTSVNSLLSYTGSSNMPDQTKLLGKVLIACLRLYGYITYARAWISMRKLGSGQSGSDEVFKKAAIRLIAGVGLINFVGSVNVISSTFGFGNVI